MFIAKQSMFYRDQLNILKATIFKAMISKEAINQTHVN